MIELDSQNGLTMLEMMVVLIIVAILVLLGLPTFLNFDDENRVTSTAQNLYYALQYARSEAIKRDNVVYVNFQTGSTWCYGINAGSNCNCSVSNNCNLGVVTIPSQQQTTLSATGLSSGSLSFDGTRAVVGNTVNLTFTTSDQSTSMGVDIDVLGNAHLCSSTISGYSAC